MAAKKGCIWVGCGDPLIPPFFMPCQPNVSPIVSRAAKSTAFKERAGHSSGGCRGCPGAHRPTPQPARTATFPPLMGEWRQRFQPPTPLPRLTPCTGCANRAAAVSVRASVRGLCCGWRGHTPRPPTRRAQGRKNSREGGEHTHGHNKSPGATVVVPGLPAVLESATVPVAIATGCLAPFGGLPPPRPPMWLHVGWCVYPKSCA